MFVLPRPSGKLGVKPSGVSTRSPNFSESLGVNIHVERGPRDGLQDVLKSFGDDKRNCLYIPLLNPRGVVPLDIDVSVRTRRFI